MQITDYIGTKWEADGVGPGSFNCWTMVRHYYKHVLGVELPEQVVDVNCIKAVTKLAQSESENLSVWEELKTPVEGAIVLMGAGRTMGHVGVIATRDLQVLHCSHSAGRSNLQSLHKIRQQWRNVKFYKLRCT